MTYDPPTGSTDPDSPEGRLDREVLKMMRELGIELIQTPRGHVPPPLRFQPLPPEDLEPES